MSGIGPLIVFGKLRVEEREKVVYWLGAQKYFADYQQVTEQPGQQPKTFESEKAANIAATRLRKGNFSRIVQDIQVGSLEKVFAKSPDLDQTIPPPEIEFVTTNTENKSAGLSPLR